MTDDFALEHFDHTLAYDRQRVMPMIKRAMATAINAWDEPIKLFASPWSPPGWMKTNGNMINSNAVCLKNDTARGSYKEAWANYITAWLTGYKAAGLPMWGLTPQNEPEARQHKFESCAYTPALMVDFIAKHLGPAVKAKHPEIKIMGYDHNKVDSLKWMDAIYGDSASNSYISGTAVHCAGSALPPCCACRHAWLLILDCLSELESHACEPYRVRLPQRSSSWYSRRRWGGTRTAGAGRYLSAHSICSICTNIHIRFLHTNVTYILY